VEFTSNLMGYQRPSRLLMPDSRVR